MYLQVSAIAGRRPWGKGCPGGCEVGGQLRIWLSLHSLRGSVQHRGGQALENNFSRVTSNTVATKVSQRNLSRFSQIVTLAMDEQGTAIGKSHYCYGLIIRTQQVLEIMTDDWELMAAEEGRHGIEMAERDDFSADPKYAPISISVLAPRHAFVFAHDGCLCWALMPITSFLPR